MATIVNVSPTNKSKVALLTVTLASFNSTVTLMVLFSAARYLLFPSKLIVMVTLPHFKPLILPFSTLTISSSLDLYVKLPAFTGSKPAPISASSLAFTTINEELTVICVGILLTLTVIVALDAV